MKDYRTLYNAAIEAAVATVKFDEETFEFDIQLPEMEAPEHFALPYTVEVYDGADGDGSIGYLVSDELKEQLEESSFDYNDMSVLFKALGGSTKKTAVGGIGLQTEYIYKFQLERPVQPGDTFTAKNGEAATVLGGADGSHCDHGIHYNDLADAISGIVLPTPIEGDRSSTKMVAEYTADHVVGFDACIETDASSVITYKLRGNRPMASRMVVAKPKETNKMVVVVIYFNGQWVLATAYAGTLAPREPWSRGMNAAEQAESDAFWATHALCTDFPASEEELEELYLNEKIAAQFENEFLGLVK